MNKPNDFTWKAGFFKDTRLEDDKTPVGCKAFDQETVFDFLGWDYDKLEMPLEELNKQLVECGIMPLQPPTELSFEDFCNVMKSLEMDNPVEVLSFDGERQHIDVMLAKIARSKAKVSGYIECLDEGFYEDEDIEITAMYIISNIDEESGSGELVHITDWSFRKVFDYLTSDGKYPLWM